MMYHRGKGQKGQWSTSKLLEFMETSKLQFKILILMNVVSTTWVKNFMSTAYADLHGHLELLDFQIVTVMNVINNERSFPGFKCQLS